MTGTDDTDIGDAVAAALTELVGHLPSDPIEQRRRQFDLGLA